MHVVQAAASPRRMPVAIPDRLSGLRPDRAPPAYPFRAMTVIRWPASRSGAGVAGDRRLPMG